jgi:methylated-DNA-[protein]-cysteine S-methyltransferase
MTASPAPSRPTETAPHPGEADLWSSTIASPTGDLTIFASATGIRSIRWGHEAAAEAERCSRSASPAPAPVAAVLDRAADQLREYFTGERTEFDLPLDPRGTPFQLAAWEALRTIPYGRTVTYAEQAARLGDARKARAVGAANGRNPIPIVVPCHRVIGADGSLTGFAGGLENKARLLDLERGTGRLPLG